MFKIIRPEKDYDYWEITLESTNVVVATIKMYHGFRSSTKQLMVNGKVISDIKNQSEALQLLESFFVGIKEGIKLKRNILNELHGDLARVESNYSKQAIEKEIKITEDSIDELEQYNLI